MEMTWPMLYHQRIPGLHQQKFITKHLTQSKDPQDIDNKQIIEKISCNLHPEITSTNKWSIIKNAMESYVGRRKKTSNI